MAKEYKLSDPGEGLTEAEIREIHVSEGDRVEDGDPLVSIETDKAVNDITAPFDGTIESVEVKKDDFIKVGDVLVTYSDGEEQTESKAEQEPQAKKAGSKERTEKGATHEQEKAATERVDTEKPDKREKEKHEKEKEESGDFGPAGPVPAAPATRKLAREKGVDLHEVAPSGPGGRVTKEDVEALAESGGKEEAEPSRRQAGVEKPLPDFSRWGAIERESLSAMRRTIARRTSQSWSQIPHVMHEDVADVTELERFRRRHKKRVKKQGGKLTLTVLVLKAAAAALRQFPRFNASLDVANDEIIFKHYHHLGIAVATDQGLLVPVIQNVDHKSIEQLAIETVTMSDSAHQGRLKREDMEGASFSVTNPGTIGATSFTPIINYPEVAILGVCSTRLETVTVGDLDDHELQTRLRLPLCLVYDHRVNDGADAARFLRAVIRMLEDPEALLLSA
ncbi:MAG: 2-oxo acid dehydrogenase subunit E2 [Oleiphilaceae bacterium]|nr:2-oxo acid dehydrogenase subunit E2 [Oleiphilaceae bacterium]